MGAATEALVCPRCGAPLGPLTPAAELAMCASCGTVSALRDAISVRGPKGEGEPLRPVSLPSPIWLLPWGRGVDRWIWPQVSASPDGDLAVMPFADPYRHRGDPPPPSFALVVAERLALETRLNVRSMIAVRSDGGGVVCDFVGPMHRYEDTESWLRQLEPSPVAALTGEHGADTSLEVRLRMRAPARGDPAVEAETSAHVSGAADTFLDWLVSQGRVTRVAPPAWYTPPPAAMLHRYASSLQAIVLLFLARKKLLSTVPASMAARSIDLAHDLAGEPDAPPQCRLLPMALTLLAAQMDVLDAGRRERALEVVRSACRRGDLLTWLSPRVFRVLGAPDEAEMRARALGSESGAYREWLDAIAEGADERGAGGAHDVPVGHATSDGTLVENIASETGHFRAEIRRRPDGLLQIHVLQWTADPPPDHGEDAELWMEVPAITSTTDDRLAAVWLATQKLAAHESARRTGHR